MLFLTYWELNEDMAVEDRLKVVQKVMAAKLAPAPGVNIIRWDETPDAWGIVLAEAENAADIFAAINVWRLAGAGFFKFTKTAQAIPVQESVPLAEATLKALAAAA